MRSVASRRLGRELHRRVRQVATQTIEPEVESSSGQASSVLATCPFPSASIGQLQLEAALPDIVRNLEKAPFVLVTSGHRREVLPVPEGTTASREQVWRQLSPSIAERHPDLYVLVHEVPLEQPEAQQTGPLEGGTDTLPCRSNVEDSKQLAAHFSEVAPFAGKLGDCCEDEVDGAHLGAAAAGIQLRGLGRAKPLRRPGLCTATRRSWGLVVQSHSTSHPVEGCYLLTTLQNVDSTGCSCIHFCASRVYQGQSLYNQLMRSWLV